MSANDATLFLVLEAFIIINVLLNELCALLTFLTNFTNVCFVEVPSLFFDLEKALPLIDVHRYFICFFIRGVTTPSQIHLFWISVNLHLSLRPIHWRL